MRRTCAQHQKDKFSELYHMATKETSDKINLHTVPMVVRFARDGGRGVMRTKKAKTPASA